MSVHFGFSEDKKPILNGGKLNGDLDADNWAILRWLDTVFKKLLENYYLFEDKEYFCYVKQHLKSSNSFTKVAQLPLLWQQ